MSKRRIKNYLGRDFKKLRENDKISPELRSDLMSKILSKNTKFEREFITLLGHSIKKRFQTNYTNLKGKPDIVFKKESICVFLDSDFWHGWQYPRWKHLLKNDFWREKIRNNRKRDIKVSRFLRRNKWKVIRVWEHELKNNSLEIIDSIKQIIEP